jgi:hypothetical protein
MTTIHSSRGASSSVTWLNCSAAPRICTGLPDESSEHAEEGTRAHDQAEAMLLDLPQEKWPYPEMAKDVQPYVDLVHSLIGPGDLLFVEQLVHYDEWVEGGFGTSDAIIIHSDGTMTVIDLKFGQGNRVDAWGNSQLRLYALGSLQAHQFTHNITRVRYIVCQPRLDHVSEETLTVDELLEWAEYVRERALLTYDPNAEATPGEEQCQWCRAKMVCRARAQKVLDVVGSDHLTTADLALLLSHAPLAAAWAKDIEAQAYKLAMDGHHLPGYKLVESISRRKLKSDAAETLKAQGLTDDQIYRKDFATLEDLQKALGGKKKAEPVMALITTKPPGQPTLAKLSDRRPPINTDLSQNFPIGD